MLPDSLRLIPEYELETCVHCGASVCNTLPEGYACVCERCRQIMREEKFYGTD